MVRVYVFVVLCLFHQLPSMFAPHSSNWVVTEAPRQ